MSQDEYVKNLCKARLRDNDTVDEVEDAGVIEA
jgi:type IV secretion system protein VirD4